SYKPGMWGKYAGRGWVYLRIGEHDAARRDFTDGLRIATQVKSQYGALLMQSYLTVVDLAQGQAPAWSLAQLAAQAEFAQSHPVVYIACLLAGQIRDLLDEPEQALAMYERAWRAAQASNVPAFGLTARARYLGRRLATAPSGDLWAELAQLGAQAEQVGELPAQALIALARANGWLASDQAAQAAPAAEQAVMLARACPDLPLLGESLVTLSDICLRLGDTVRAQSALAEAQTIARQSFALLAIPLGLPEAGRLRQHCLASLQPQAPDRTIAPRKRRGA
ncbi:MAG: hypothetical protein N2385_01385, partial [Chloroflexus sp.]|nr:hypothetical protein [Chloroflexus sp.]